MFVKSSNATLHRHPRQGTVAQYLNFQMSTFESLGLSQKITEAVSAIGFETPTAVQAQAIPRLLAGKDDFIGLAQTGTGKTAAFGLPLIQRTDSASPFIQSLVLAPTRELCLQITKEMESFCKNQPGLQLLAVYGGADIGKQIRTLSRGVHILVATPGRLRDLMRRGKVDFSKLQHLVLDEADEMLNMGFKEEIDEILESVPKERLTWLFSATMPPEVRRISDQYMNSPFELSVGQENASNADIDHQYILLRPAERYDALRRFLDFDSDIFALVFCRTRRDTAELAERLTQDGYNADALHGDLNQSQRDRVMSAFRAKRLRVLIATDVAARGIDVDNITHVFHFNIPDDRSFYTHRAGRTGRAGRKGISLVLAHPNDQRMLRGLERSAKIQFTPAKVPSGKAIFENQLVSLAERIAAQPTSDAIAPFLPQIMEHLQDLSKEEIVLRMASASLGQHLSAYANSRAIGQAPAMRDGEERPRFKSAGSRKVFINLGRVDIHNKGNLIAFLCEKGGITGADLGKIELMEKHAFVQAEEAAALQLINRLDALDFQGRKLRVNDGGPQPGGGHPKGRKGTSFKGKPNRKFKAKPFRRKA